MLPIHQRIEEGLIIEGKLLFGVDKAKLRKEIKQAGGIWNAKLVAWLMPDWDTFNMFVERLGGPEMYMVKIPIPIPVLPETQEIPAPAPPPALPPVVTPVTTPVEPALPPMPSVPAIPMLPPVPALPPLPITPTAETQVEPEPESKPKPKSESGGSNGSGSSKESSIKLLSLPHAIIVAGKVSVPGSVTYEQVKEEVSLFDVQGVKGRTSTRVTKRTVQANEGYEAANKLADDIRIALRRVCRSTPLGWLCRKENEAVLNNAIISAKQRAAEFNKTSLCHFVRVSVIKTILLNDDGTAARELAFEMQQVLDKLKRAMDDCDAQRIRTVAVKVKSMAPLFDKKEEKAIRAAVEGARAFATKIIKETGTKQRPLTEVKKELDSSAVDTVRGIFAKFEVPHEMDIATKTVSGRG